MPDQVLIAATGVKELNQRAQCSSSQGLLCGAKVGLFTNNVTLTPGLTLAALTEPTWAGYSRLTVTWEPAYVPGVTVAELVGQSVFFFTDAVTNTPVYGCFVVTAAGDLYLVEREDTPIQMGANQGLTVVPLMQTGGGSGTCILIAS